jgi:alpha-tubulin suppressor-like RCC1 family protein
MKRKALTVSALAVAAVLMANCSSRPAGRAEEATAEQREALGGGQLSSASLQLQELTNSCTASQVQDIFQVVNSGAGPVTASDITIKYWAYDTSGVPVVPNVFTGGCLTNAKGCFHQVSNVVAKASPFAPACGPDASHQANWEITISNSDPTPLAPGVTWANIQTAVHLANYSNFAPGTADWYSPCLGNSQYASDGHFGVYVQGNLVFSSGIAAPSCRAPHGSQQLQGHITPAIAGAPIAGPVPQSMPIHLAVSLPTQDPQGLAAAIQQVYDPASPSYHHFLSQSDFVAQFSASSTDYGLLQSFAQANGLAVIGTYPTGLLLDVSGTIAQVEQAFFVNIGYRLRPDGTQFFAPDREPSLNSTAKVAFVGGLDDFTVLRQGGTGGSGPFGFFDSSDLRNAYAPCTQHKGATQVVGLLSEGPVNIANIQTYMTNTSLNPSGLTVNLVSAPAGNPLLPLVNVPPNTQLTPAQATSLSRESEIESDAEMVIAMAPAIPQIVVYEITDTGGSDSALHAMANDPTVKVFSSSWGSKKSVASGMAFAQFALKGQTFVESSGDSGGLTITQSSNFGLAFEDGTTTVGGTVLSMSGNGQAYASEVPWLFSSGGNTSDTMPSYQSNVLATCTGPQSGCAQVSTTNRNFPDLSMISTGTLHPSVGAAYVVAADVSTTNTPTIDNSFGGTSVASPLFAGFLALANEEKLAQNPSASPGLGLINSNLYAIAEASPSLYAACFNDITGAASAGNANFPTGFPPFPATPGYDLVTGLGTPRCQLLYQLGSATPTVPPAVVVGASNCALRGGVVSCWQFDSTGTPGAPSPYPGLPTGVTSIATSAAQTCAALSDQSVDCWGDNGSGQLGQGSTAIQSSTTPLAVHGIGNVGTLAGATAVTTGLTHSCALLNDGSIACWGTNLFGQLGDGSVIDRLAPVKVTEITQPALAITAGTFHTCAILKDRSVTCWGRNDFGQLAGTGDKPLLEPNGTIQMLPFGPFQVSLPQQAIGMAAGLTHTCVLLADRSVWCWGLEGFLGDGNPGDGDTFTIVPQQVHGLPGGSSFLSDVASIATTAQGADTCAAARSDGSVACWGTNAAGQLGAGADGSSPFLFQGVSNVTSLAFGGFCGFQGNGGVVCWRPGAPPVNVPF